MRRYRIATLSSTAVIALCGYIGSAVAANTVRGWTPAQAAAKLKAAYSAPDPKWSAVVQANIDQEKAACGCDTDARLVSLEASLSAAQHLAKPTAASCRSAGRLTRGRSSRFHCTVKVLSSAKAPPDYVPYSATFKVTVRVPYRVLAGWR